MVAQDLTLRMILSSLSGWLALATTCAVWTPLIIMNAARLRVSASPRFIYIYLFGDFVNLLGVILGKLPPTQLALGIWYLSFFGHLRPFAPDPQPTLVFSKLRERKRKHPRWYRITLAFMSYSLWDDVKLLLFCIAAGLAAGGIYLTLGIYHDPEHFAIEVPRALDLKSFVMGLIAQATVCLARIPELRSGESRSKAGFKPVHAVDDPLFWFLTAENFFNLLSILLLSTNAQYLLIQSPWIGGAALMILLDGVLIWRIAAWQKRWNERKGSDGENGAEKEAERAARLAKLDEEKAQLEEEWEVEDMHVEAYAPVPIQRDGESKADYKRRVHAHVVARKDYLKNQHLVADIKARGERRADRRDKKNDTSSSAVGHFPPHPRPATSRHRADDPTPFAPRRLLSTDDGQHADARDFLLRPRRRLRSTGIAERSVRTERI
ncbi:Putative vacuolar membrane transporter for cationic amino acids [Rhodotorula toruloides]